MATIPDNNFSLFLREDFKFEEYVLTDSLEKIGRDSKFEIFWRHEELNKWKICDNIEKKLVDFAKKYRLLTSQEETQAIKNLKAIEIKFFGTDQNSEAQMGRNKIKAIIKEIKNNSPPEKLTTPRSREINIKPKEIEEIEVEERQRSSVGSCYAAFYEPSPFFNMSMEKRNNYFFLSQINWNAKPEPTKNIVYLSLSPSREETESMIFKKSAPKKQTDLEKDW